MTVPVALQAQLARRSVSALVAPGPTDDELALILQAATTVPDHGNLRPWRFVVVRDGARDLFGDALAQAGAESLDEGLERGLDKGSGEGAGRLAKLRTKAFVAPTLIVLIAVTKASPKVPPSEQRSSAACTGYAMALAADALGLGAAWKTARFLKGARLSSLLALQPGEEVLGWVNVGHRGKDREPEFPRPDVAEVAQELRADATLQAFGPSH
jgi:nitroreductase